MYAPRSESVFFKAISRRQALKALSFRRPASDLDVHRHTLEADFREHPPASAQHAMDTIETLTGVDLATSLGIELLYLPAYFPNLNLIERLWKFVKKKCLTPFITKISRFSNKPFQPAWAKLTQHIKKPSTRC